MNDIKPLILITNDDGIHSPGLKAAAEAVSDLGDILISAPHMQQTGMGRAFPRNDDVGIIDKIPFNINGKTIIGYAVHGSPAFSVAHGILELTERKPDLCISGINYGENIGLTLTCSGTVGAVFEADSHNIHGIAISIESDLEIQRTSNYVKTDWTAAKKILKAVAENVLKKGMPGNVNIYNINVPSNPISSDKFRFTTQSRQNYFEFIKPLKRNFNKPYSLQSKRYVNIEKLEKNSDIYALYIDNMTSVTPINTNMSVKISEVNNYKLMTVPF